MIHSLFTGPDGVRLRDVFYNNALVRFTCRGSMTISLPILVGGLPGCTCASDGKRAPGKRGMEGHTGDTKLRPTDFYLRRGNDPH